MTSSESDNFTARILTEASFISLHLFYLSSNRRPKKLCILSTLNNFKVFDNKNYIRLITSRRTRWVARVARMGEMRNAYSILVGKSEGRDHLEDLGVDGEISECILGDTG
jgi:hypothetical protein